MIDSDSNREGLPGLKAARERAGLTQAELGAKAGLTPQMVSFMERGAADFSANSLRRLVAVLGCTPNDLLLPSQSSSTA